MYKYLPIPLFPIVNMKTIKLTEEYIRQCHEKYKKLNHYKLEFLISLFLDKIGTDIPYRAEKRIESVYGYICRNLPPVSGSACHGDSFYKERGWNDREIFQKKLQSKSSRKPVLSPFNYKTYMIKYGMDEDQARYEANKIRPIRKEYWLEKGFNIQEAEELAKRHKDSNNKKGLNKSKKTKTPDYKNPLCLDYYLIRGMDEESAKEALRERQSTFTLEKCIERYGEESGFLIWEDRQIRWQNTLKNKCKEEIDIINSKKNYLDYTRFREKYSGCSDIENRYRDYISRFTDIVIPETLEEYIEELKEAFGDGVSNIIYTSRRALKKRIPFCIKSFFGVDSDYIIAQIEKTHSFISDGEHISKSNYGVWTMCTEIGFLRSSKEINFYKLLIQYGYKPNEDFILEQHYPNSPLKCDFYFPKKNIFVEICGSSSGEYYQRMLFKQSTFGAVLLHNKEQYINFIESLNESNN